MCYTINLLVLQGILNLNLLAQILASMPGVSQNTQYSLGNHGSEVRMNNWHMHEWLFPENNYFAEFSIIVALQNHKWIQLKEK